MSTYVRKLAGLLAALLLALPLLAAAPLSARAAVSQVADLGELLSDEEETALAARMEQLEEEWKQTFVIVTTRDAQGKDAEAYADDYYDARIEEVLDAGYEALQAGQYARGLWQMLDATEAFLGEGIPAGNYRFDPETGNVMRYRSLGTAEILFAAAAGLAAGGILFFAVRSRYRSKSGSISYPFRSQGNLTLTRQEDHFVNQVITHRKIPKSPPSGGGGSSVHRSSGGVRHGGGGRSL